MLANIFRADTVHKLIGFADIELQVIVVAPCDEALYQSLESYMSI